MSKDSSIQIGKFKDDPLAYSHFCSKFEAQTYNNPVYTDEEKLIQLIRNLGPTTTYGIVKHSSPEEIILRCEIRQI